MVRYEIEQDLISSFPYSLFLTTVIIFIQKKTAFVSFPDSKTASDAADRLKAMEFPSSGKPLRVDFAKSKTERRQQQSHSTNLSVINESQDPPPPLCPSLGYIDYYNYFKLLGISSKTNTKFKS